MKRVVVFGVIALVLAGCATGSETTLMDKRAPETGVVAEPDRYGATEANTFDAVAAGVPSEPTAEDGRKIIVSGSIDLEVAEPENAQRALAHLVTTYGGYISDQQLHRDADSGTELTYVHMTVRIPVEALDRFVDDAKNQAVDVRNINLSSNDISEQYADIEAQLRNLNAYETELRALLSDVTNREGATPEDLLTVYNSIREVRGEIEQLEGRQRLFDNQVALATIEMTLTPSASVGPIAAEGWSASTIVRDAARSLVGALRGLASAGIWAVVFALPIVALIALPFLAAALIVRAVLRRRRRSSAPATSEQ